MATISYKLKNAASIGTTPVDVYTVPGGTTALVHSMIVANRLGTDITVDVTVTDNSTATTTFLVKGATIPAAGAIIPLGDNNKQALEASDKITVTASQATAADATLGIMEQT